MTRPAHTHNNTCAYRWTWAENYPSPCSCPPDPWWWVLAGMARVESLRRELV